jgi:two-component system, cell cycle sensor histidine kinase and response regulator CckA
MPASDIGNKPSQSYIDLNNRIRFLEKALLDQESAEKALKDSEKRYRRLFESAKDGILILDAETGTVVDVNPFLLKLLGYSYDTFIGRYIWELGVFKDIASSKEAFKTLQDTEYIRYDDLPLESNDGQSIAVEFVSNVYLVDQGKVIQCNIRDIRARKQAEAERNQLISAVEQVGEAIIMTDAQGIIQFVNPAFERTTGYLRTEVIGKNTRILRSGEHDKAVYNDLWATISGGLTWKGHLAGTRKDGTLFTEDTTISPVFDVSGRTVNYVAVKRDITEHLKLVGQLQQAQKMEAVGQLAGGVAHDFNNMLTVIIGYADLAMMKVDPTQPLYAYLKEIQKAAVCSTDITRQLLAFARKQAINPVILDLNSNVASMLTMLRRLIGENVELVWLPGTGLCPVNMDPVQVGQILTNLCVNARDAISDVGKVTIETGSVCFDEIYCRYNVGFVEGEYALLAISDNGCGMNPKTLEQIFEPFFTTKVLGQGTGLGLSTVYGIVKQNDGFITVYSEPGYGTTFKIYLPRHADHIYVDTEMEKTEGISQSCGETVLLVEDQPQLLKMAEMMLDKLGYRVLAAGTPGEAIRLVEGHAKEIELLLTDVVMPEMNGRDLAELLKTHCPCLKILFMSGYTASVIVNRGVIGGNINFIQKPFSLKELSVKVREVLSQK